MTNWETVKALVENLNKLLIDKGGESYGFPLENVPDSLYQLLADAIDKSTTSSNSLCPEKNEPVCTKMITGLLVRVSPSGS